MLSLGNCFSGVGGISIEEKYFRVAGNVLQVVNNSCESTKKNFYSEQCVVDSKNVIAAAAEYCAVARERVITVTKRNVNKFGLRSVSYYAFSPSQK